MNEFSDEFAIAASRPPIDVAELDASTHVDAVVEM
jgi:hypothetical protein